VDSVLEVFSDDPIAVVSLLVASASFFYTWLQGRQRGAISIRPLRYDPIRNEAFFNVAASAPVQEVEFEFINDFGTGGTISQTMVPPGDIPFQHRDFVHGPRTLNPDGSNLLATARWRRKHKGKWATCGVYVTARNSYSFRPLSGAIRASEANPRPL
jgi:hypothetical protein